jgi:hypothetical protein
MNQVKRIFRNNTYLLDEPEVKELIVYFSSIIDEILNKPDKERLVQSIKTYINFDMKSDLTWHDPSPANTERAKRVLKDAENIAKIAIDQLLTNHKHNS